MKKLQELNFPFSVKYLFPLYYIFIAWAMEQIFRPFHQKYEIHGYWDCLSGIQCIYIYILEG